MFFFFAEDFPFQINYAPEQIHKNKIKNKSSGLHTNMTLVFSISPVSQHLTNQSTNLHFLPPVILFFLFFLLPILHSEPGFIYDLTAFI